MIHFTVTFVYMLVCEITETDKRIQFITMTQQLFLVYSLVYQAINETS